VSSRKASRLDAAISAFAEHICESSVNLHACKEHFVSHLDVYTGDDDAFVDDVGQAGDSGNATSNARGAPERFSLAELALRSPSLLRALYASAMARLPVELHGLVCSPIFEEPVEAAVPPRWEYATVCKTYCFFFDAAAVKGGAPASRCAPSSRSSAADMGLSRGGGGANGFEAERPSSPPRSYSQQPFQLQSLYDSVFLSEADAHWYVGEACIVMGRLIPGVCRLLQVCPVKYQ
jgi:hypothetical protein